MRILVSAYACEPGKGSEPAVGWNYVRQASRFYETWVITRKNNRRAIERALFETPLENIRFVYYDLPRWAAFWKKGRRGMQLYYYLWQVGAYFRARRLQQQVGFHLVHHVTFVKYWVPSFLALLSVPFVWGPVGGGESVPPRFFPTFSMRGKIYESMRHFARRVAIVDPFVRLTARRAKLAMATTPQTARRLRELGCRNILLFSQVGLAKNEIRHLGNLPIRKDAPIRILSVGSLLHLKGFNLALKAFARFSSQFPASEYWLIGDGPERKNLESLARRLGVSQRVVFWGALTRAEVFEKIAECDVLLHPALHDSGGCASVEAMAAGRPVICLDLGGPALQVTKETGICVPADSPQQVIGDLAAALERLASDTPQRLRFGQAARERISRHFCWERKGELLAGLQAQVANRAYPSGEEKTGFEWAVAGRAEDWLPPDIDRDNHQASRGGSVLLEVFNGMTSIIRCLWFDTKRKPFVRAPWVWLRHRGLDSTDVFLASYPRSGQYWLRFLLAEVLTDTSGEFDIIDRTIPKVGLHGAAPPLLPGGGRLVQTHEGYRKEYKKAIYLVRDLRDVVLSEYDHARAGHPYMTESFGSFEHYLLESLRGKVQGIPCWNNHVLSWLESPLARRGNLLIVRFEQMRCNPDETLAGILEFLGVPATPDAIRRAIVNNSLERMRGKEDRRALRHSGREEDRHVRSGSVGGWREKLTPKDVKLIEQYAARALMLLGYQFSDGPSGKEKSHPDPRLDVVCQPGRAFESQA